MFSGKFDEQGNNKGKKKTGGTGREKAQKPRSFCICYISLTKSGQGQGRGVQPGNESVWF